MVLAVFFASPSGRVGMMVSSNTKSKEDSVLMSVSEVKQVLGLGLNQIYSAIHRKEIPSVKIGGRYFVPRVRFQRFLDGSDTAGRKQSVA